MTGAQRHLVGLEIERRLHRDEVVTVQVTGNRGVIAVSAPDTETRLIWPDGSSCSRRSSR